jgi:hypothetical protein
MKPPIKPVVLSEVEASLVLSEVAAGRANWHDAIGNERDDALFTAWICPPIQLPEGRCTLTTIECLAGCITVKAPRVRSGSKGRKR